MPQFAHFFGFLGLFRYQFFTKLSTITSGWSFQGEPT